MQIVTGVADSLEAGVLNGAIPHMGYPDHIHFLIIEYVQQTWQPRSLEGFGE